jgi:hypothetical protein
MLPVFENGLRVALDGHTFVTVKHHWRSIGAMLILLVSSVGITMLTAGCASDVANRYYGDVRYPEKDASDVEILWHKPDKSYVVIADFQSRGESPRDMQRKAAKIGADAVIVSLLGGSYDKDSEWAGDERNKKTYSRITGTAIKYNK